MKPSAAFLKYYEYLNTEEQVLFMRNISKRDDRGTGIIINNNISSLMKFLNNAFVWSLTDEGHDYWSKIALRNEVPFGISDIIRDLQEENQKLKIQLEEYKYEINKITQSKHMVHE